MIDISVTEEGVPLVFSAEDWLKLREHHRIVGSLIGCIPSKPYQEIYKGLPLALLPEEATLLRENNIARLVKYSALLKSPVKNVKEDYKKYCKKIGEEQIECLMQERKRWLVGNIDQIVEGKKRKLMGLKTKKKKAKSKTVGSDVQQNSCSLPEIPVVDKNKVLEEELKKVKPPLKSSLTVQIFTVHPWLRKRDVSNVTWNFPSSPTEILRYKVFKHFWEKEYFLTSGQKFGADYLVYPGDPLQFHAYFMVICIERNAPIRPIELAAFARLGTAARKSVVLAYEGNNQEIRYQTLKWSNMKDL